MQTCYNADWYDSSQTGWIATWKLLSSHFTDTQTADCILELFIY